MVKAKWCNVMDPEACKQKDCDPCDSPDGCPDLAYAKPCDGDGGVHVFNRYVINSRPEHFWKYCEGDRCTPLKSNILEHLNIPHETRGSWQFDISKAPDWSDCCRLCDEEPTCAMWSWDWSDEGASTRLLQSRPAIQAPSAPRVAPSEGTACTLYEVTGSPGGLSEAYTKRLLFGKRSEVPPDPVRIWGLRGYNDIPVSCAYRDMWGKCSSGILDLPQWILLVISVVSVLWAMFASYCVFASLRKVRRSQGWLHSHVRSRAHLLFLKSQF